MRTPHSALVALLVLVGCTASPAVSPSPGVEPTPSPQPAVPTPATTPTAAPATPAAAPATPTAAPATPTAQATAAAASVAIFDLGFNPQTLDVSTGTQVSWTNTGALPHTVTFDDGPDSGVLDSGQTYQLTFETPGSFSYICTIHPSMTGTITVSD